MNVLVTGGLGGIGRYVSKELIDSGMNVTILGHRNKKYAKWFPKDRIVWGDISNPDTYRQLLPDLDAVIHTAFMVKPQIDVNPRAHEINVGGIRALIEELEQINPSCRFIFTSSVAVFGTTSNLTPPIPADHPVNPNDIYSNHKVECEELIKKSKLKEWIILRIALASYIEVEMATDQIEAMFDYPADLRIEFVHVKDVALACKNALTTEHINESYIIGGGSSCQMTYYDVLTQIFSTFHLPPPPREKFSTEVPYGNDWYDTTRSQKVFQYQRHTFDDYLKDVQDALGRKRIFLRLMSPITSLYMKRLYNKP